MKTMRKVTALILTMVLCVALGIPAFAAGSSSESDGTTKTCPKTAGGAVYVKGVGTYEFEDGTELKVEPIPEQLLDLQEQSAEKTRTTPVGALSTAYLDDSDFETVEVHVDGIGEYDLGNGVILTIEEIPGGTEDGSGISTRLHESNSKLPLTEEWSWFCSDEPLIYDTNIKIYNNSRSNPGNLNARVTIPYGQLQYDIYDIEPGHMGTISVSTDFYSVKLSASVIGYYNVLVTDWP
mgnify:CR=1 FL=1